MMKVRLLGPKSPDHAPETGGLGQPGPGPHYALQLRASSLSSCWWQSPLQVERPGFLEAGCINSKNHGLWHRHLDASPRTTIGHVKAATSVWHQTCQPSQQGATTRDSPFSSSCLTAKDCPEHTRTQWGFSVPTISAARCHHLRVHTAKLLAGPS